MKTRRYVSLPYDGRLERHLAGYEEAMEEHLDQGYRYLGFLPTAFWDATPCEITLIFERDTEE